MEEAKNQNELVENLKEKIRRSKSPGTLYEIILKGGTVLECFSTETYREILQTYHANSGEFGLFVQENGSPRKCTYVLFNNIDFIRFPKQDGLEKVDF